MTTYNLKDTPAESQYKGCGKAWAAIKDGTVLELRYMNAFKFDAQSSLPAWVLEVQRQYSIIAEPSCRIEYISSTSLGKLKKAAIEAGHPATGPRGGNIPASHIAKAARHLIMEAESVAFSKYRDQCRSSLVNVGDVVSGMCSCYEFVVTNR